MLPLRPGFIKDNEIILFFFFCLRDLKINACLKTYFLFCVPTGKYVGSRPIKLRKSMWKDRNMEVVRKKQKEKKKLGLR